MAAAVFLLVIYTGAHEGYIAVPNLPSEAACQTLYLKIIEDMKFWTNRQYRCIAYETASAR